MRILHFCNYADRIGGAEVYAHSLIAALRARGHEVALFGTSPEREVDSHDLRVIQRPPYDVTRLVQDAAALNALREYVERYRPEVVHAHNLFSISLDVIDYLGRCGVPLVHTVHDYQLLCPNSWCVRGDGSPCPGGAGAQCFQHACERNYPYASWDVLLAALRQRLASAAARIALAPSFHLAARLREHGWRDVRHHPYFIDGLPSSPAGPRADSELLYVGRLEREKGVEFLLEAMTVILSAIPRVRLTIVGGGSQEQALRRLADHARLGTAVRFLAQVPRHELPALYGRATACVLPSVWTENSPLVAYECLATGLPMLGSRIGGIPELVEPGCGLTFQPRDPADIARTVVHFLGLSPQERERMSTHAKERAKLHDKPRHLDRTEHLYRDAVSIPAASDPLPGVLREFFPLLEELGTDLRRRATPRNPTALSLLRAIARGLGLPKVIRD